jgi:hypothetical protein
MPMTDTSFCCVHHEAEPVPQDCFLICFECKHVFRTAQDLVAEHNATMAEFAGPDETWAPVAVEQVGEIFSCPMCAHDL